jgi:Flp pilus assembly protein TadG
MMKWTKHIKDESGASAIIVALMLVVLLGAAALAMDLGSAYSTGAKVQNTCDAAALAAAKELPNRCSTESVAKQFVKENGINPKYAKITINDSSSRVEVSINKKVNTGFAKILGINTVTVQKRAIASKETVPVVETHKKLNTIFNYLLFQGSTDDMVFNSGGMGIYGQVHGNGNIKINAALCALGGISESGNNLYATSSFPVVKKNESTGEFEEVGTAKIQWWPYKIQIQSNDGSIIDDITNSEYYIKEEKELTMPDFIIDNVDALIPSQRPTLTSFSGWDTISSDINSASSNNVHFTGKSGTLTKSFSHIIYADGDLEINSRTNDIVINGDIYVDGNLKLSAYGCKLTINGNLYVSGNTTFSTNDDITVNGNIYCCGDINSDGGSIGSINCDYVYCNNFIPGGKADISGVLVAENKIKFTSSSNSVSGSLAVVSKNGDIDLTAGSQEFNGIVYAPKGTISLGGVTTVHGNLIANKLNLTSAIQIYPLTNSIIDDLYDTVLKDSTTETTTSTSTSVKLVE